MTQKRPIIGILSLLLSTSAFATGCIWYVKYEQGPKVDNNSVRGEFKCSCSEWFGTNNCQCKFIPEDHSTDFTNDLTLTKDISGASTVQTESFEAMKWEDCDGSDPVPEYQKNGIYESFTYDDFKFERFSHD